MSETDYSKRLPDRNDTDIPKQIQWFLSVCELANIYVHWLQNNIQSDTEQFCDGVVSYWWGFEELEEPTMGMLEWRENPSNERVAYQKGAIIGYNLAEEYKDDENF